MHIVGSMAVYSSSPPANWSTQCSMSSKTFATADIDLHSRGPQAHYHSSKPAVKGGLSSLFSNANTRPPHHTASEALDSSSHSHSSGQTRSSLQADMAYNSLTWDTIEGRSGAVNIPVSSSLKSRERSPVSVLQGPVSRSSNHGSPTQTSFGTWESTISSALPPLDPHLHIDHRSRRRSSFSGERDRSFSRSLGFEVGSSGAFSVDNHSRLGSCRASQVDTEVTSSESVRVEGFGSGSFSAGCSPLDTFTLPLFITGRSLSTTSRRETPGILEAREKVLRLVEQANGPASPVPQDAAGPTHVPTCAEELLKGAQAQYKVFYDPCVLKAFRLAEDAHNGQMRRNGDLYLEHCVETAMILAATGAGSTVVAAGLLHDAIDDSTLSQQLLRGTLGDDVADLVLGVSKLSQYSQLTRDNRTVMNPEEADGLRTMILAMVDVRVVLIKIADRLHNMRTLGALPASKQIGIADETLQIFAPLANRLGIWSWKAELEDLCFKCLNPSDHKDLAIRLSERCREALVMSSIQQLDESLRAHGVKFIDLSGRPKNLYSVYKKMTKKGRTVEEIFDVRGLRLIVPDEKSCYKALKIVQQVWQHLPGKSKDYIVEPKANGYQSLHTVVVGDDGYPLEVQIRTMQMHHQAEYGLAAHWRYKEDNSKHSTFNLQRVEWARWVLTWHSEILDTKLRLSPLGADLKPPCPFPVHYNDCPYAASCCGPPLSESDPVFIIKLEEDNMAVQELAPGSTVADLIFTRKSDLDSVAANSISIRRKETRVKVNHQFVDTLQKLRMGDLVEVTTTDVSEIISTEEPCGKICLEFQREQLKRMYLEGGNHGHATRTAPLERCPSVAGLT